MIDIGKILKRAWHILWNYKVLWIFGVLLALTAGGGGSGSSYQFSGDSRGMGTEPGGNYQQPAWMNEVSNWIEQHLLPVFTHPEQYISTFIWVGVGIFLFILVFGGIGAVIRYVSETAIIRMVDEYEQSGTKLRFKQGWKLGWNKRAFRLWVIDLVISLPALLFISLIFGMGLLFFFSAESGNDGAAVGGVVAAIGCSFLFLFAFVLLMVLLGLLRNFFVRYAVLEEATVGQSFRQGWAMFKRNWKSILVMWLVMLGIGIGFGIASMIVFFILIPAYAIMIIPAAIVAAIPGLIALGISALFTSGPLMWIIAVLVALPFFMTVVFLPLALISGCYMIYDSNIWTLTFREIKALEATRPAEIPAETK